MGQVLVLEQISPEIGPTPPKIIVPISWAMCPIDCSVVVFCKLDVNFLFTMINIIFNSVDGWDINIIKTFPIWGLNQINMKIGKCSNDS